jgi:hypothetical protein
MSVHTESGQESCVLCSPGVLTNLSSIAVLEGQHIPILLTANKCGQRSQVRFRSDIRATISITHENQ